MPRKPKRPCGYRGCPELVDGYYCEKHKKETNRKYEKYKRDTETSKRYGRKWRKIRKKYIAEHPLCEICFKNKRMVNADHVHHIKPLKEGGTNDEENLMSLCISCHSRIHKRKNI